MDIVERLRLFASAMKDAPTAIIDDSALRRADEIERSREALQEIYEVYAGSEGIPQPMTAAEGYLLFLLKKTAKIAQDALKKE
jgi:hypothetical protein